MDDQITDCIEAHKWCLSHLPSILRSKDIDINRYVLAGDSAGGALATTCAHLFEPAPKAVIDIYGVIDMSDQWFWKVRQDRKNVNQPSYLKPRDEEEYRKAMEDRDPANAEIICPWDWELEPNMSVADLRSFWGMPDFVPSEKDFFRIDMYKYMGRNKSAFAMLFRREQFDSDEQCTAKVRSLSAYYMLDGKTHYPPTFFLHGTGDVSVPVEQSYRMAKRLRGMGVPVGEAYCEGGPHSFEQQIEVSLCHEGLVMLMDS